MPFRTLGLLCLLCAGCVVVGVLFGSVPLSVNALLEGEPTSATIFWSLRLPRVLLGLVLGGGLAVSGVVLQAAVGNPLADPYVLGGSSGASAGAVLALALGWHRMVPGAAFIGALAALLMVLALARKGSRVSAARLILSGVAVGYAFGALTSFLTVSLPPHKTRGVVFWLLGGLNGADWTGVALVASVAFLITAVFWFQSRKLNLLASGEESAWVLGLNSHQFRHLLVLQVSLLVGACVAAAGPIGFVGLVVPHWARLWVGGDHRWLLPTSFLAGGALLILADLGSRTVLSPSEVPVGILTAAVGVPFFILLLRRERSW